MKELLPIGSVVILTGGIKRLMITGYFPQIETDSKKEKYDYIGCLFPEGELEVNKTLVFNHEQIEYIYYYGLRDEEQQDYSKILTEKIKKTDNNNSEEEIELPNLNTEQK